MEMLVGTSGYSYKEWVGHFYPDKLPANAMLRYYGECFPTVEVNNTFYRMPAETVLQDWAKAVPAHFSFTLKAPRRITHDKRLRETEAAAAEFLRRAAILGDKLGVLLFQLPPFFRKDVARLRSLLEALSSGRRIALEFRNASWQDDEVYDLLRAHAAMLCITDSDKGETPFVATSDWGYLRLRREHYDDAELRAWIERIRAQPLARAYVYFKHEEQALGPRYARRFAELWSAPKDRGSKRSSRK